MKDSYLQPEISYQWHDFLFSGIYGSFEKFENEFSNGEKESGQMAGGGIMSGVNIKLSNIFYLQPQIGFTLGNGKYKPPVPSSINNHPSDKKIEREYLYQGFDLSLGLIMRSSDRIEISFSVRYTHESWKRRNLEGIRKPNYPLVSPKQRKFNVFRGQIGVSYRFSLDSS